MFNIKKNIFYVLISVKKYIKTHNLFIIIRQLSMLKITLIKWHKLLS